MANEILTLQQAYEMLKKSYDKKEKGWEAFARPINHGLFELTFKGPDILLMIVQDTPYASMMVEEISDLPAPWRPVGRGVILDEDPAKVNIKSDPDYILLSDHSTMVLLQNMKKISSLQKKISYFPIF